MLIDITLKVTPEMMDHTHKNEKKSFDGHMGTHFDVMDQEFPLEYTKRDAVVFDVSKTGDREIETDDIDPARVKAGMFVAFYTGFIERVGYGSKTYFSQHPQLSMDLIDKLLKKNISIIGVDFAGMRRGEEHSPKDQYCAQQGVFIIENLCNLKTLLGRSKHARFVAHTYPLNYAGMTGLPCRVVAQK
ncbi:MAG: cyclase family protein [Actinomycetia bacterium]|nr:cyclase family protein [Actinomycetes bacterium]